MKLDPSAFVADQDLLAALETRSSVIVCDEERVLFNQGDMPKGGLYVLRSGSVILILTSHSGETVLCTQVHPGALLGLSGFIGDKPYSLTARVAEGAELGFITRDDFDQLMLSNPFLPLRVLSVLAAEVRSARSALADF